jgi:hypothetical protein
MKTKFLSLMFAGATFAFVSLALLVPALLSNSAEIAIQVAGIVVGLQAAQSTVVQIGKRLGSLQKWLAPILISISLLISLSCAIFGGIFPTWLTLASQTIAGALVGLLYGQTGLLVIHSSGGMRFQAYQAARALYLCTCSLIASWVTLVMPHFGGFLFTIFVALGTLLPRSPFLSAGSLRQPSDSLEDIRIGSLLVTILGLGGSLYFRNDTNWIRDFVAGDESFKLWHVSLVAYSGIQALVGFLVIQVLFANRKLQRERFNRLTSRKRVRVGVVLIWAIMAAGATVAAATLPILISVGVSATVAALIGLMSGIAHISTKSWLPYAAGILGATCLLICLSLGVDPRLCLAAENLTIGSLLIAGLFLARRRTWK